MVYFITESHGTKATSNFRQTALRYRYVPSTTGVSHMKQQDDKNQRNTLFNTFLCTKMRRDISNNNQAKIDEQPSRVKCAF